MHLNTILYDFLGLFKAGGGRIQKSGGKIEIKAHAKRTYGKF